MQIEFTKLVYFRDQSGDIERIYAPGDRVEATAKDDVRGYFVTAMGGVFFDEAAETR